MREEVIESISKILQEHKLTPYDLMSWAELLDLEAKTRDLKAYVDMDTHFAVRKSVANALWERAKDIDYQNRNSIKTQLLKHMKVEQL